MWAGAPVAQPSPAAIIKENLVHRLLTILGAAALGLVLLTPSTAVAHAEISSSDPADRSTVETMPAQVSLTLSEPARTTSSIAVTAADGTRVNGDEVTVQDDTVTTIIEQPAPAGTYTISYDLVSADGHEVTGDLTFLVRQGPTPTPTPAPSSAVVPTAEPQDTPSRGAAAGQPAVTPTSGASTTAKDVLTILGFFVIAMAGLALIIRAGLRSASSEDDD